MDHCSRTRLSTVRGNHAALDVLSEAKLSFEALKTPTELEEDVTLEPG